VLIGVDVGTGAVVTTDCPTAGLALGGDTAFLLCLSLLSFFVFCALMSTVFFASCSVSSSTSRVSGEGYISGPAWDTLSGDCAVDVGAMGAGLCTAPSSTCAGVDFVSGSAGGSGTGRLSVGGVGAQLSTPQPAALILLAFLSFCCEVSSSSCAMVHCLP
jgi:hypothetical protein